MARLNRSSERPRRPRCPDASTGGGRDPDPVPRAGGQGDGAGGDQEEAGHHAAQRAQAELHPQLAGGHHLQRVRSTARPTTFCILHLAPPPVDWDWSKG